MCKRKQFLISGKKRLRTTQETAISTHTLTQLTHVNAIATFRIHNNDAICYVHPPTHLSSFDIRGLLVMLIYKCAIKEKREIDNRYSLLLEKFSVNTVVQTTNKPWKV